MASRSPPMYLWFRFRRWTVGFASAVKDAEGCRSRHARERADPLLGPAIHGRLWVGAQQQHFVCLEAEYREFVAVVGCTLQMAGPVQVLIDDRVVWECAAISSLSPAEQIEIAIPAGAKTLTLQSGAESLYYGFAAFAEAGFVQSSGAEFPSPHPR